METQKEIIVSPIEPPDCVSVQITSNIVEIEPPLLEEKCWIDPSPKMSKKIQPINATKYYNYLIHGYIRDIENNIKLIPEDIKALCVAFYYTFLRYNDYIHLEIEQKSNNKLFIETKLAKYPTSAYARLISRIPINSSSVTITFDEISYNGKTCICSPLYEDYTATADDELDLVQGDEYAILTNTDQWWCVRNKYGHTGYIPSNYVKCDNGIWIGITTDPELFMCDNETMNTECIYISTQDYNAQGDDELELKKDEEYTIEQKSVNRWWYAVNKQGDHGWIPSNYVSLLHSHPICGKHIKHAILESDQVISEIRNGEIRYDSGTSYTGGRWDISIDNDGVCFSHVSGAACAMSKELMSNENGDVMDYYFVMAVNLSTEKNVKFEICSNLVGNIINI